MVVVLMSRIRRRVSRSYRKKNTLYLINSEPRFINVSTLKD
jgi:hypothetical protein